MRLKKISEKTDPGSTPNAFINIVGQNMLQKDKCSQPASGFVVGHQIPLIFKNNSNGLT
jgi:hypothetical protein